MAELHITINGAAGVGSADKVVPGVLTNFYTPTNLPANATAQIEVVVNGVAYALHAFTTLVSPYAYPLQRQSYKEDGAVSGNYIATMTGALLQIRASNLGAGSHTFVIEVL